ncbi:hypothetical protein [Jeotgalibacillus sp. R-1-5s-1]|uniref:hypothetical protein n=1 Tax=Jeotgalibacillus sp. R-1-5s-1 TaxID=2555897 RepID=UPI0010699959|nr:hypothetical protein [Jeotgalibacillus sp. R-1-5s-1]TFD94535.1 hypothetical protein E2491_13995 [Jeotgalibacillus sp. R-1-5s-1]
MTNRWISKLKSLGVLLRRFAVLFFALFQPVSVILIERRSGDLFSTQGTDPFIIPAGYAFSIWSVIVLGTMIYAVYQLLPRTYKMRVFDEIAGSAILIFMGFAYWIWLASMQELWGTVLVFIGMGLLLRTIYLRLLTETFSKWTQYFVRGSFALYYGWTTVAVFSNLASALHYYGLPQGGVSGLSWQAVILVAALFVSYQLLDEIYFSRPYFAAIIWAFASIVVGTILSGLQAWPLILLSIAGTIFLLFRGIQTIQYTYEEPSH